MSSFNVPDKIDVKLNKSQLDSGKSVDGQRNTAEDFDNCKPLVDDVNHSISHGYDKTPMIKECTKCNIRMETKEHCFNLLDYNQSVKTDGQFLENKRSDGDMGSLQFYGRTLENCSNCGNLQVHNRFLEDNRDVLLRLNLGGFSPVIVNNVFKTCESKGRDFDCRLVILGARPRSSAAYAVISDQNSLPVDKFNTQSPFIFGQCTAPHSYSQLSDYYASIYSVTQNSNSEASTNSIVYSDITTAAQLSQNQQSSPMNPSFKPAPRNQVKSSKSDSKIRYFRSKSSPGVCNEISKKNFASEEHNSDNNHSGHFYISVPQISSGSGETSLCFDVQESSSIPVGAKTGTNKEPFQFTNYDVRKRNKRLIEIINQSVANKRYLSSMGRVTDTQNDGTMQEEHVMGQLTPQSSVMKHPYSTKLETIQNDQPSGSAHDDEKSVVIEASTTAMVFKSPTESGVSPGKVSLTERNQICVSVASPVPIISSDNRGSEILQIDGGNADELDASNLTKRSDASTREGTADVFSAIVDNKTLNVQITREREQDITKWSNLDVVSFFKGTDCAEYAYIFEQEEIDGEALLLLNEEKLHNFLGVKMGPAMKIARHIRKLKHQLIEEPERNNCS